MEPTTSHFLFDFVWDIFSIILIFKYTTLRVCVEQEPAERAVKRTAFTMHREPSFLRSGVRRRPAAA